ncbi:TonB-dependent receptor [Shewanella avicenniae]|uniref:TonB-dependent receptor n=1 Tax=Shewanella avicenniae TaxID=2814294 RepID=A0ABX7QNS4_9GAMM|nr:TonB-dependent receptor [Shewanella avicenniae]QSX33121.1 TonB-dependent receptor [Shewanella avicenniae]
MFKQTYLASAIFVALTSHALYAAEDELPEAQQTATAEQQATSAEDIEVIQVVGIRSSLNKSVNLKRQNVQVVDAIVAEDVGKFPDNNVVEALQRVTGVQVTDRASGEVNTVSIRGLTDVTTTVNGRQIFTAAGRQVAIADVPAALLGSVEVFKTRSSSQVGSGIAGQIDIRTHRPFDFEGSKVSMAAKGVYSDQPDKIDPAFSALASNRWDTSLGEVGALLNVSYIRTNYNDQSVAPGASLPYSAEDGHQISDAYWTRGLAHGMDTTYGATTTDGTGVPYLLMRDAVFQNSNSGERTRPALNLSLQWAPTDTSEYLFEAFYNGYRNDSANSMLFSNVDSNANWDQVVANGIELYDGTNVVKSRTSYNVGGFSSADHSHNSTDSYVFALGGKWELGDVSLKSEVVYQTSTYKSNFLAMRGISANAGRFYGVDIDYNASSGGVPAWSYLDDPSTAIDESDITQAALWQTAELYDSGTKDEGDSVAWTLDGDYYLDWGIFTKMKFGVRYEDRGAKHNLYDAGSLAKNIAYTDLDPDMFTTVSGFYEGRGDVPTEWILPDGNYLYSHRSEIEALYEANPAALAMYQNYDISEKSYDAYIQSDFETQLFGKTLDGQIGLRYEHAKAEMNFGERKKYSAAEGGDYYIDPSSGDNSSSKLMPNLMLRYWLTDDVVARLAYSETIRRPAFGDFSTAVGYTEDLTDLGFGQASSGNPNLKPTTSKNYDFSLEYYFGSGSSVYGTYFRRDIDGFVFSSSRMISREVDGEVKNYILSQPANTSNGKLTGYEVGSIYFPENLPSYLDGLGAQLSATFLDSEQDIPEFDANSGEQIGSTTRELFGVSKSSYSAVLIYDKDVFSTRLSYTWRDKFLNSYDAKSFAMPRGIYRKPEQSLDFQMSYNVSDDLVVTFDATNILDDIYQEYYEDSTLFNRTNNIYTRTFSLGMRYSF